MNKALLILFFLSPYLGLCFDSESDAMHFDVLQEGINPDGYPNKEDEKGLRQGMWTIWGHMKPEKGYPENGKIEEGGYIDSRKDGEWVKYHKDGETPRLKGVYIDNRPNGLYTKYWENGAVMEEGKFSSGKQVEVFKRFYDTGVLSQEKYFNEEGKENGQVTYYHPNGQIEFQYTKQDGVTVGNAVRYYPNGDVKEEIEYNTDGTVASRVEKERVNPAFNSEPEVTVPAADAPDGSKGTTNGKRFKKNGYNKVYNDDQELWMDGEFKDSRLWDGKLYKYDSDGILLKIEVWKKGKYHSDGQL